ncbi:hypothetical protein AGDE_13685 [Angomonas deanei]|uniref:Uncharacterized protein n=1 Tax=Angomonas deanei TaxID=59799 RepID=A0A7G2C1K4_9TRYP|nr:hypothetical protein AGDE_13685 [Angomonas deanei]CAD2213184.1 hypothetical protein, conserved [Angomonas deanei]|eukprot:EPY21923.1 hypothetical protein AGDE_13685 [Angomonas deanei]
MAKHLWYSAVSSHSAAEETKVKRLEEKPQLAYSGMLEGDSTFLTVKMDPTQQWAAFYCDEGVGRLYIVEMAMGVIFRIKRGCREAQFQWWVKDDDDRRQLLLVLYSHFATLWRFTRCERTVGSPRVGCQRIRRSY